MGRSNSHPIENHEIHPLEQAPTQKNETLPLYPERVLDRITQTADQLEALEVGTRPLIELSEDERELILENENRLGEKLEQAYRISPRTPTFSPEYFLTEQGKADLEKTTGVAFPQNITTPKASEAFLFSLRHQLKNLKPDECSKLGDRSVRATEQSLIERLNDSMDEEGNISFSDIPIPRKLTLLTTPEKSIEKIRALYSLKQEVKALRDQSDTGNSFGKVNDGILRLYQKRINTLLIDLKFSTFNLAQAVEDNSASDLTEEEKLLLQAAGKRRPSDKNVSRYDRLLQGAATDIDEGGKHTTLGDSIREFADEIEREYIEIQLSTSDSIREKGLDEARLKEASLSAADVKKMGDEALSAYGVLSSFPGESYSPNETGPAADGKWRFVLRPEYRTFSVDSKRKTVKGPAKNFSALEAIPVSIAHETEGHMLQHENRSQIPLRIFKEVGAGRSDVLAECGAMNNEDFVSRNAFGAGSLGHPHYLRAMERRAQGGDYFDCVQAFYESAAKADRMLLKLGKISEQDFIDRSKKNVALAVNRAKRLFQSSTQYSSKETFLSKSKDTAYLEQIKLAREFQRRGLDKYIFIAGIDIDDLPFLVEAGILDSKKIKPPIFHALKVWEKMKDGYSLAHPS